jgi:hypothetical protein
MNAELYLISLLLNSKGEEQKTVFTKILDRRHQFHRMGEKLEVIIEHYKSYQVFHLQNSFQISFK